MYNILIKTGLVNIISTCMGIAEAKVKDLIMHKQNAKIQSLFLILFILISFPGSARENEQHALLKSLTTLRNPRADIVCHLSVTTYKGTSLISEKEFTYFADSETDQFLLICVLPSPEQGIAYVKRNGRIWTYNPKTRLFFSTSAYDSIEGTGIRVEDFLSHTYEKQYTVESSQKTNVADNPAVKLVMKAATETADYHGLTLWFSEEHNLLIKTEAYDSENHMLRQIMYTGYREEDGWSQPSSILFTDTMEGTVTSLVQIKTTTLTPIPEYVFTRSFVEFITQ